MRDGHDTSAEALALIASAAPELGWQVGELTGGQLPLLARVHFGTSGKPREYRLLVSANDTAASVSEDPHHRQLPAYCPERHVNEDGTFCLYWRAVAVDDIPIIDPDAARRWCRVLHRWLEDQIRAAARRRWPSRRGRAHGYAAVFQYHLEDLAAQFGPGFVADFAETRFSVQRVLLVDGREAFRLLRDGVRLASIIDVGDGELANLKRLCICDGATLPIKKCGRHRHQIVAFIRNLLEMEKAERAFWDGNRGVQCCGTMESCPLAALAA